MQVAPPVSEAHQVAIAARSHAHVPYSGFRVGAALKLRDIQKSIGGCNVENASFGATVCAERTAILRAVAEGGRRPFEFLVVVTDEKTATVPCALCLQMLAEFAGDNLEIYLANLEGISERVTLGQLLPRAFRSFDPGKKEAGAE